MFTGFIESLKIYYVMHILWLNVFLGKKLHTFVFDIQKPNITYIRFSHMWYSAWSWDVSVYILEYCIHSLEHACTRNTIHNLQASKAYSKAYVQEHECNVKFIVLPLRIYDYEEIEIYSKLIQLKCRAVDWQAFSKLFS